MRNLLIFALILSPSFAFSAPEWKVIGSTTDCNETLQIMGKDGEKYVKAVKGDSETKLVAKDGAAFEENNVKTTEFVSEAGSENKITYVHPGKVDGNPAKVTVGSAHRCRVKLK